MKKNPCHECENRTMDCHSTCREYKVWEIIHKIEKSRERKEEKRRQRYYVKWKNK